MSQPGARAAYLLPPRVWRSAQYNVTAKMQKAAAIMATTIMSVGIGRLPRFTGSYNLANDGKDFDPDQITIANGIAATRAGFSAERQAAKIGPNPLRRTWIHAGHEGLELALLTILEIQKRGIMRSYR